MPVYLYLIVFIWGYLLGSFPSGFIAGKLKGIDLTKEGSGSTGTTNVLRMCGKPLAIFTLVADFAKGALCFYSFNLLANLCPSIQLENIQILAVICCLGAIIGHVKSIWIGFKGGKAVATGVGTFFALDWQVGLIIAGIWILVALIFKISSLSGLSAAFSSPIAMYFMTGEIIFTVYCSVAMLYIFYKHKANIQRLLKGEEPKFGQKKKEESE